MMTKKDYIRASPDDHAETLAKALANNHAGFESFGWSRENRPIDDENWAIVYLSNRDSGLCNQSNESAILGELKPWIGWHKDADCDVEEISHGHWACGHIDGMLIRVYRTDGSITDAFKKYAELAARIEDYPLLDEEDHTRREYEATLEAIGDIGRRMVRDDAPEGWEGDVFSWFWNNNQIAIEPRDDQGGYPSDEDMRECLEALGYLQTESE